MTSLPAGQVFAVSGPRSRHWPCAEVSSLRVQCPGPCLDYSSPSSVCVLGGWWVVPVRVILSLDEYLGVPGWCEKLGRQHIPETARRDCMWG